MPPEKIGDKKGHLAFNASNLPDGKGKHSCLWEDMFIRKFMHGTWSNILATEIIIKRRLNIINISAFLHRNQKSHKIYFLLGYSEEFLKNFLKRIVNIEIQTIESMEDI